MASGVPGPFPGSSTSNQPQIVSPFPAPPDYAANYTTENIKSGKVLPPPPVPTKFTAFNEAYDLEGPILKSLGEMQITQYYDRNKDWKSELKKLNRSIVAAFLDLLEILIKSPDHPDRMNSIETIRLLFFNMHHLINEYRPVQARDTLKQMAIRQNQEIKDVNEKLRKFVQAGNAAIESLQTAFKNIDFAFNVPSAPKSCRDSNPDYSAAIEQTLVSSEFASNELAELLRTVDAIETGTYSVSATDDAPLDLNESNPKRIVGYLETSEEEEGSADDDANVSSDMGQL
ncbi:MED7 protein [Aphelenchoides avenae]|nr:MED7 protein [Aphelenchus avenae]